MREQNVRWDGEQAAGGVGGGCSGGLDGRPYTLRQLTTTAMAGTLPNSLDVRSYRLTLARDQLFGPSA